MDWRWRNLLITVRPQQNPAAGQKSDAECMQEFGKLMGVAGYRSFLEGSKLPDWRYGRTE